MSQVRVVQISSSGGGWADPMTLLGDDWPAGFEIHTVGGGDLSLGGGGGGGGGGKQRYSKGWKAPGQDRKPPPRIVRLASKKYPEIKKACLQQKALWEDPDFPAVDRSVFYSYNRKFEWKRPSELCENPRVFVEGASRFDIVQGDLGNCWFLAALASMCASKQGIVEKVVPADNSFTKDYIGAFHFRIWQYGKWIDVCIDDRLPTLNGKLVFVHSVHNNEFWSALLEKAYAKVNGSYEAMVGGCAAEAMEDFTGGLCETYKLNKDPPKNMFQVMKKAFERNSLLGCTIDAPNGQIEGELANGLIMGHAYSITSVMQAAVYGRSENLLRIRNPWGNQYEWKGAWGDSSNEWKMLSEADRNKLGIKNEDDGEFWMTFNDFMANFHNLEICHLDPRTLSDHSVAGSRKWVMNLEDGSWRKRVNAGGCRNFLDTFWTNPQYRFEVVDPDEGDEDNTGTVIIALMQKETRRKKQQTGQDLLTMGYMIYKVPEGSSSGPLDMNFFKYNGSAGKSSFSNMREIVARHKLPPGHYVVLPCTFNPGEEGDFILRIFSEKGTNVSEIDEDTGYLQNNDPIKVKSDIPVNMPGIFDNFPSMNFSMNAFDIRMIEAAPEQRRQRVRVVTEQDVGDEKNIRALFKRTAGEDLEVDASELRDILNSHFKQDLKGEGISLETCRSMVAMMDVDRSGKLGYEEFKKLWNDLRKWKKIFKEFDQDKNGTFNSYELREALNSAGFRISNSTYACLVLRYSDKAGKMYFDDFILCAVKLRSMCDIFNDMAVGAKSANFSMDEFIQTTMYA